MATTWKKFMKDLESEAKSNGPDDVKVLRALRRHYRKLGQEVAAERKKLQMSQEALAKPSLPT